MTRNEKDKGKKKDDDKQRDPNVAPIPAEDSVNIDSSTHVDTLGDVEKDASSPKTIAMMQKRIADLEALLARQSESERSVAVPSNSAALALHATITAQENASYSRLREAVTLEAPKLEITSFKISPPTSFSLPLTIIQLNKIPSLFTVETIGGNSVSIPKLSIANPPLYLEASMKAFSFGFVETHFVLKSVNLPTEISFKPDMTASIFKDVIGKTHGPVTYESSRAGYVLRICETLFQIYLNAQFVLVDVPFYQKFDRTDYSGDLVSMHGMLRSKYADQDMPLLPTAGLGSPTTYLLPLLKEMFQLPHHHMCLGEIGRDVLSRKKVFRRAGVVTDQFLATLNELYLTYLASRHTNQSSYLFQHNVLTMPQVSLKIDKPTVFANSLVPVWRRDECDGSLLLYALNTSRQQKYLNHLTSLLYSTNLVSFATIEEVGSIAPRKGITDPDLQQLLDNVLSSFNQYDFFRALAMDLSTTWIDIDLAPSTLRVEEPLHAVFRVFIVLLWFRYFPSIARDNAPRLMFELFISLELLHSRQTSSFLRQSGFVADQSHRSTIREYSKESYLRGDISFPLLTTTPPRNLPIFRTLHDIMVTNHGRVLPTRDTTQVETPRMSDVRTVYQPYEQLLAISNSRSDAEDANEFANDLKLIKQVLIDIIEGYKRQYKEYTSRSALGPTPTSVAQLVAFFNNCTSSVLNSIGIRVHAEIFALRALGANSPYVPDCQNFYDHSTLTFRPQVAALSDVGNWSVLQMQRLSEELPFELPLALFLTLRGATHVDAITPPDAVTQFKNLRGIQEEGILCGDVIRFVNNIKFGNVGVFNREALGLANIITAARAERIFSSLSQLSSLSEFKDLFTILINDVAQKIDSRAVSFKILLQPYNNSFLVPRVPQPVGSMYDQPLKLGRSLMDDMMTIASPLFVPETSPISLYTNGLLATHRFQEDLDPFQYVNLTDFISTVDRIVMWSPELVTRRVKDDARFIDEDILRIQVGEDEVEEYTISTGTAKILIIVNAVTGAVDESSFSKLIRYFHEGRVSFFFPDLMVIMNRQPLEQQVQEDVKLTEQLQEVVMGLPNRRITLVFGDTITRTYKLSNSSDKLRYLYPVSPIDHRDVIIRGMDDQIQKPSNFQIGTWQSWAFGEQNGKVLKLLPGERLERNDQDVLENQERVINKLDLGVVNMNNEMKVVTMPEYLLTPTVIQNNVRAYAGIYNGL